ncbi:MAG TPA: DUF1573 domain-containing protein [Bacteroidales bacterium]
MKKLVLLFSLGVFMLGNLVAQTDTTANKNKPEIKFDKTDIDLGIIPQGQPKSFEFEFTNEGDAPLVLSNVQPTCGCTIADWPKGPIEKGKKGIVKGTYNGSGSGLITKTITVYSNAKTSVVYLTFKGNVQNQASSAATK